MNHHEKKKKIPGKPMVKPSTKSIIQVTLASPKALEPMRTAFQGKFLSLLPLLLYLFKNLSISFFPECNINKEEALPSFLVTLAQKPGSYLSNKSLTKWQSTQDILNKENQLPKPRNPTIVNQNEIGGSLPSFAKTTSVNCYPAY